MCVFMQVCVFDLVQLGCQDILCERNKQVTDVTNLPKLLRSQIFPLGRGEIKTVFNIIMILSSQTVATYINQFSYRFLNYPV